MKTYDKYKSSGIDWIGDIPEHWEVKKLKYWINSTFGGGTPSTGNTSYWNGNIPWVSPKDMKSDFITKTEDYITELAVTESATNLIPPERVLIVVRSGILKHTLPVAINKVEVSLNQDIKAFEPIPKLLPVFLFWKLKGQSSDILTSCNKIGATVDSIEMEDLFAFPFALPPIEEQTAIADYLDEKTAQIDKLITEKRRLIELLKEERLGVINQAVTRGINRHAKLKPSGIAWLGDIPEHWEVKKLKYLTSTISKGTTPSTIGSEMLASGSIRFIKAENILQSNIVAEYPQNFIDEETNEILKRSELQESDILIVIAGATIGKVAILQSDLLPANTNQAVCFIRLIEKNLSKWIHFCLQSRYIKETISLDAVQSAQPNLSMEKISNFIIFVPPIEEQKQIVEFIETATGKIDATIATIEKEIGFLREYRTALISEVVTGKIKVI